MTLFGEQPRMIAPKPRVYQNDAIARATDAFVGEIRSILIVMATGLGKTHVFSHIGHDHAEHGRVLVVAHRDELIRQAADKIYSVTGEQPEIEKAGSWASSSGGMELPKRFIVASIQSLTSGPPEARRMMRFNPDDFSLLVIDEAHRAAASTYVECIAWFTRNPKLRVVGVTATPDRTDKMSLPFEEIVYRFEIHDACREGWLLTPTARTVVVGELDLSQCRKTANGDLNDEDVAAAMEKVLHPVAHASIEATFDLERGALSAIRDAADRQEKFAAMVAGKKPKKTLVFASSVAHAGLLSDIFNRWSEGSSRMVNGKTDPAVRAKMLEDYAKNAFPILVNVGVATEGFDDPGIEIVIIARPTSSRSLFVQMMGRGTRPASEIAGLLGTIPDAAGRLAAIAGSSKPGVLILDFVGNLGKHKLVSPADIVAGPQWEEIVIQRAKKLAEEKDINVEEALEEAAQIVEAEREEIRAAEEAEADDQDAADEDALREQVEAERRKIKQVGTTQYQVEEFDLFDEQTNRPDRDSNISGASFRQLAVLRRFKVPEKVISGMSPEKVKDLSRTLIARSKAGLCSYGQAKVLERAGYSKAELKTMTRGDATKNIEALKANRWIRPREGVAA